MIKNSEEWTAFMRDLSLRPGAHVEQKDGKWTIVERKALWERLGPRIFDDYLDRLEEIAVEVLREPDPVLELEPDKRVAPVFYGKPKKYSDELRGGLAETLALLGSFPHYLTSASLGKAEATAAIAVRKILNGADWTLWASLNHYLPLLAEADPNEFLSAVDTAVSVTPSPFVEIYAQESGGVFGRNYMTGLLWALETLAWHPDYLTRVIVLLGDLAVLDPGGNWRNRPENSAIDILLPWHPQTCADVRKRKAAVIALLMDHPSEGWRLLLNLLPSRGRATSGTRKPQWRLLIPPDCNEKVSNAEYWEQVNAYAEMAVDLAAKDVSKLPEMVSRLPDLPDQAYHDLLEIIAADSIIELPETLRQPVWEALVTLTGAHRKYSDADWAMPADQVTAIENIASKIAPTSANLLFRRLFGDNDFELMEDRGNFEAQREKLAMKRQEVVRTILDTSGVDGILSFGQSVVSPWQVGISLGAVDGATIDKHLLPDCLDTSDDQASRLCAGFIWGRWRAFGWGWVDGLDIQSWTEEQKISLLLRLPFCREAWERLENAHADHQSTYWLRTNANVYQAEAGDLAQGVEQLLKHGRLAAAIQSLEHLVSGGHTVSSELIVRTLGTSISSEEEAGELDPHAVVTLIKWLQKNADADPDKLMQIEWRYLPLLSRFSGGVPNTLMRRLAKDPNFFCEVIRTVFKPDNEADSKEEISEARRTIAENAYSLLHDWRIPPGSKVEGEFDEVAFNHWLDSVKKSTRESGHLNVAMIQVGEVLAYSPPDANGLCVHRAAAEALNAKDADDMRSGFIQRLFNMRGAYGYTAGQQERQLEADYRDKADAVENAGYHRLAIAFRELASWYRDSAERDESRPPH